MEKIVYYNQLIAKSGTNQYSNLIVVTGEGELALPPDLATVNMGVITENKELIQAQQKNSTVINKVIQSLLSLGIPHHQIQTFDYRIDSEYDFEQGKQIFRGYKVTHLLQVKIEDLSLIGKIVDTAVQMGANYVANVQFTVKNKDLPYQQVLSLALKNAIQKAITISTTLKVHLQPIPLLVIEGAQTERPFITQPGTYVKGISSTTFEPGQLVVKAAVTAHFQFQPL